MRGLGEKQDEASGRSNGPERTRDDGLVMENPQKNENRQRVDPAKVAEDQSQTRSGPVAGHGATERGSCRTRRGSECDRDGLARQVTTRTEYRSMIGALVHQIKLHGSQDHFTIC